MLRYFYLLVLLNCFLAISVCSDNNKFQVGKSDSILQSITNKQFYLFIIAIEQYADGSLVSLDYPIRNATIFKDILLSNYTFDSLNVTFLKNPTKDEIISSFIKLGEKLTINDNLLIYFSGHILCDEYADVNILPSDYNKNKIDTRLSMSEFNLYIRQINSKHILLISDSLIPAIATRSSIDDDHMDYNKLYKLNSRIVITSGIRTEIFEKEKFSSILNRVLVENNEHYLPSSKLFLSLKTRATIQGVLPKFGRMIDVYDEGGVFLFIKK